MREVEGSPYLMDMYFVYFLTNKTNRVLYIGVTRDLKRRYHEHKSERVEGFTKRYHVHKLVYYEVFHDPLKAIEREKQLKGWRREKKNNLICKKNPQWMDLADQLFTGVGDSSTPFHYAQDDICEKTNESGDGDPSTPLRSAQDD